MLEARVKANYRYSSVQACGGHEFIKSEFRPVPLGTELSLASYRECLEIREAGAPDLEEQIHAATEAVAGRTSIADILEGNVKTVVARVKEAEEIATLMIASKYETANKDRKTVHKAIEKRCEELLAKDDEVDPAGEEE